MNDDYTYLFDDELEHAETAAEYRELSRTLEE